MSFFKMKNLKGQFVCKYETMNQHEINTMAPQSRDRFGRILADAVVVLRRVDYFRYFEYSTNLNGNLTSMDITLAIY